jgi:hypothetical protein
MTAMRILDRPRLAPSKFNPGGMIGLVSFIITLSFFIVETRIFGLTPPLFPTPAGEALVNNKEDGPPNPL